MTVTTLTHATYNGFTTQPGLVLTSFWSTSCGPCLRFRRIYQAAAREIPDAAFGEAEVELQQLLVRELAVAVIPTLLIYCDGELLYRDPTPGTGNRHLQPDGRRPTPAGPDVPAGGVHQLRAHPVSVAEPLLRWPVTSVKSLRTRQAGPVVEITAFIS